jgi:curved DNA-binding protein CbpA
MRQYNRNYNITNQNIVSRPSNIFERRSMEYKEEMEKIRGNDRNAFRLYELPRNFTLKDLKKKYYKLSRVTHPDKHGGSEELFSIVTKYYLYLMDYYKRREEYNKYDNNEESQNISIDTIRGRRDEEYNNIVGNGSGNMLMNRQATRMKRGSGKGFDLQSFNKIFEENAFYDPSYQGYGDWLNNISDEDNKIKDAPKLFGNKFNKNVFNTVFEQERRRQDNTAIIPIDEIKTYNEFTMEGATPIDNNVESFSASAGNIKAVDIKDAYTTGIIQGVQDPSQIRNRNFGDENEYKRFRESQMTPMTQLEMQRMRQREEEQQRREEERLHLLRQRDIAITKNYNRIKGYIMDR